MSLEQLAYDCRLLNTAASHSDDDARRLRDWLVESDAGADPQAWVLRPDVVLRISEQIVQEITPYRRTRRAVLATLDEIRRAHQAGALEVADRDELKLGRSLATVPFRFSFSGGHRRIEIRKASGSGT